MIEGLGGSMDQSSTIALLLSTFNGHKYLKDFLDSLASQSYQNFILFVRDDGSSDETVSIIETYKEKLTLHLLEERSNLGAKLSFNRLLEYTENNFKYEYFMFADQDDIWLPDKIESTFTRMKALEHEHPGEPVLIHTDLIICDEIANVISPSFWDYQNLDPSRTQLNQLLVQNVITGCTMMINRKLAQVCQPIPQHCMMHDWWIGLVASCFGHIGHLNKGTILYRQHGKNQVGTNGYRFKSAVAKIREPFSIDPNINQCFILFRSFEDIMDDRLINTLTAYLALRKPGRINKIKLVIKWKFYKKGLLLNSFYILRLLRCK
ncbi:glycosyltransferase family 2 protein [Cohnella yongneupensis]|uniref:Glycosyltransferase family 2 protein n=1 Tax=Cohnella yongneupensis TaxID=425006 RepID=A0ABW0R1B5_9BACL